MDDNKLDSLGLPVNRITEQDITSLKGMFENDPHAARVLRKLFYPELTAEEPLQMNNPLLLKAALAGLTKEQKLIEMEAQQKLVSHVEGCLSVIKHLVGEVTETPEQVIARLQKIKKDSSK